MKYELQQKLLSYYYHSKVKSYIFSNDIDTKLKSGDITKTYWFYRYFSSIIEMNKEHEILSEEMKDNCYILLNKYRNFNKDNKENINNCNELIRILNTSGSKNSYEYLESIYITTSFNQRKSKKRLEFIELDYEEFEYVFDTNSDVACLLLLENNKEEQAKIIYNLAGNEFYFHALVDITKCIPEIFNDDELVSSLYGVLKANNKMTFGGKPLYKTDTRVYFKNIEAKKYIKKRIK